MDINIWAVLVCAVVAQVLGMIWYGQMLFGNAYMKVIGVDHSGMTPEKKKEMQKGMGGLYFLQFILSIITAGTIACVLNHYMAMGAMDGIKIALGMWFGIAMPLIAGSAIWSGKSKKLSWDMFLITAGYHLVVFIIFGAILGAWM